MLNQKTPVGRGPTYVWFAVDARDFHHGGMIWLASEWPIHAQLGCTPRCRPTDAGKRLERRPSLRAVVCRCVRDWQFTVFRRLCSRAEITARQLSTCIGLSAAGLKLNQGSLVQRPSCRSNIRASFVLVDPSTRGRAQFCQDGGLQFGRRKAGEPAARTRIRDHGCVLPHCGLRRDLQDRAPTLGQVECG